MPRKLYRIIKPREHAIVDPETQTLTVPDPTKAYAEDHPYVIKYPHLFEADNDDEPNEAPRRGGRPRLPRDAQGNIIRE